MKFYKLKGQTPVPCSPREGEFGQRVAKDSVGSVTISTVFLCVDHNFDDGPPILFETMIFGGSHDGWQERCSTYAEALEMHKRACALVGI